MVITKHAVAGTLESSDILIDVSPLEAGLEIEVQSVVLHQFGAAIEESIRGVLAELGVTHAKVFANDRGALDCTVRARTETALRRATEEVAP